MAGERGSGLQIGRVLREARGRAGLDIAAVEERTKIRTLYLRALEDEQWDALPSPAYAKGFLRTYAQLLGLDAEALVDEFRRQVEGGGETPGYPLGEGVLERRPRSGRERRPGPGTLVALAVVAVAAALAVIGLAGGDDDEPAGREAGRTESGRRGGQGQGPGGGEGGRGDAGRQTGPTAAFALELIARAPVEICLLDRAGEALIDGQVLAAGTREAFTGERFELRFPSGFAPAELELRLDGDPERLPKGRGPSAFRLTAAGASRAAEPRGLGCP